MRFVIPVNGSVPSQYGIPSVCEAPAIPSGALLLVTDVKPAFNAATQKVIRGVIVVEAAQARETWQVVALTQAELDDLTDRAQIAAILAAADDMIAGAGTTAQRMSRLENGLGRLLKRLAKNGALP